MSRGHCPRPDEFKPCANPVKRAKTLQFLVAHGVVADAQQPLISGFA
jgi:hypothetical protein